VKAFIGVDVGGTKIAAWLCDSAYQSLAERVYPTPPSAKPSILTSITSYMESEGRAALLATIVQVCEELQAEATRQNFTVSAIGIGSAGQIDTDAGTVLDANENLVGWRGTPLASAVQQVLAIPVFVENDVRAMALAECRLGAGQGYEHVLCVTVGTGIGGAIVLNGQVWHGAHFSAGEIGYLYAAPDQTIEQLASGAALERRYQVQTNAVDLVPLQTIAQRAMNGDEIAHKVIEEGARLLAHVLSPVITLIDPQAVVVGGGVIEMETLWWQPFVQTIQQSRLATVRQTPVLKATFGNRAGMMGAAVLAMQKGDA
jgi:glucokinase